MKYTPEQLAGMSDNELNETLADLISDGVVVFGGTLCPDYCTDWAATGPLMVKYGVAPLAEFGELRGATSDSYEHYEPHGSIVHSSRSTNPLRAVVECLILVLQEGE